VPLSTDQRLLLARTYYEGGEPAEGQAVLLEMLDLDAPPKMAVIEFALREGSKPRQRPRVRQALEAAHERHPDDSRFFLQLVNLHLAAGQQAVALQRLDEADLTAQTSDVSMLRAYLRADQGNIDGAIQDARHAFNSNPELPGLVDLFVAILSRSDQAMKEIDNQRSLIRDGRTKMHTTPGYLDAGLPWRSLLVARLHVILGQDARAVAQLDEAIKKYEVNREIELDLAFLLAKAGQSLPRAQQLALKATREDATGARGLDTVGFVFLERGKNQVALEQFRKAIENAEAPEPLYHYHEYLALERLERNEEALRAIETVLALNPHFPDASRIRNELRAERTDATANPG
jgi:tetratricopeptide (TPR) repeat protein